VSFFELPPEPEEEDEEVEPPRPVWAGPASDELGAEVPLHLAIGESDGALVALQSVTAYEHGLILHLAARAKREPAEPTEDDFHSFPEGHFDYLDPRSAKFVRFGVQFADGSKVTNLEPVPSWWEDDPPEPEGPVLIGDPDSGGYEGPGIDLDYWLWPLPPPPGLRVVVEWPEERIGESSAEVAVAPLLEARSRNTRI
jgi:hypothetical protein